MFHPISPEGNDYHKAVPKTKAVSAQTIGGKDEELEQRKEAAMSLKEMLLKKNNSENKEKTE